MAIGPVLGVGSADATAAAGLGLNNLGKEEFLSLLVTQLQMQDPFNPMNNEQMIAQLAQFSSLEQLQNMNGSLQDSLQVDLLLGQLLNNSLATNLIGKKVTISNSSFNLPEDGSPRLGYRLYSEATVVEASIYDADGKLVAKIEGLASGEGEHSFTWNGCDSDGNRLPPGTFNFQVSAKGANEVSLTVQEMMTGIVDGIRYRDGSAYLVLEDMEIILSDVVEVSGT